MAPVKGDGFRARSDGGAITISGPVK